jgi:hypothetical protein
MTTNVTPITSKLEANRVEFTTESFMSNGFWGTRILVPNKRNAIKAHNLTGYEFRKRRDGRWHLEIY